MIVQDVPGVIMTQAAARDRANLTGLLDTLGWLAGIMTTSVSVTALRGHNWPFKIAVIAAVSVANYVGSVTGVLIGKKFVKAAKS